MFAHSMLYWVGLYDGLLRSPACEDTKSKRPRCAADHRTHRFICPKHTQEPHGAWDRDVVSVEQVEEIVALGAVRDVLAKLRQRHVGICQVGEPSLTFGVIQRNSGRQAE